MGTFKVGAKVTIWSGADIEALSVVHSVSKLKVTLKDGSVWRISDGRRWGSLSSLWTTSRCRLREPGDEEAARRQIALARFHRIKPTDLPLDVLEQIVKLAGVEKV